MNLNGHHKKVLINYTKDILTVEINKIFQSLFVDYLRIEIFNSPLCIKPHFLKEPILKISGKFVWDSSFENMHTFYGHNK